MFVLGLQGSPRTKGNTSALLCAFLSEAERLGARTLRLDIVQMHISPCLECGTCEREGFCPIDDDMQQVYPLLWRADLVVMATPIFFYGPTAQMKALIDRSQALWARRYVHRLSDPGRKWRRGLLLSLGATKGKSLFDGTTFTAKYFFDAVGATFEGGLTYRRIEGPGDIERHPTALSEAREKARALVSPFLTRKRILFASSENACRSQMAGAFARFHGGDRLEVDSAGSKPVAEIDRVMVETMQERGIDMAFQRPQSVETALKGWQPDTVVCMGCEAECPPVSGVSRDVWGLPDAAGKTGEVMRQVRDEIEERVKALLK
jgi:arsenate reductase